MGKLAVFKYLAFMMLVVTVLLAVFTLFALFGGAADPSTNTALAMLVYVLPLLIIGNVVTLLVWLVFRRWHWMVIPGVTLLCCIRYVGTIYNPGWNFSREAPQSALHVASYNVACFGREVSGFKAQDILQEMRNQNVEVFCIQEYYDVSGDKLNSDSYKEWFEFMATGREDMVIYSRYPIIKSEKIDFGKTNNSGMWADIEIGGNIVRVFNVHLETTGINRALYKANKKKLQGQFVENNTILKAIFDTYTFGMARRARQAEQVAQLIKESQYPVIVCGDFNDVPYSYVYETMLGDLVDGFRECGEGFMYTMTGKKNIRIDYIFHDKSLNGETYYKRDINYSDHYPVFMKLSF
jgi:endonuclease/exonuclease/phosphatase family metal-dependent hydrolase